MHVCFIHFRVFCVELTVHPIASPLTELPETPPPEVGIMENAEATPKVSKLKRKLKEKKQIIDTITELEDGPGAKVGRGKDARDLSDILTEPHFLPRSRVVMRLLEIHNDPIAHFLPTKVTPEGTYLCAAPPGLAPELAEFFMIPLNGIGNKRRATSPGKSANKRQRLEVPAEDEEVEVARRAESVALGSDIFGRGGSMGPDPIDLAEQTEVIDDFQLDVPPFDPATVDIERARSKSVASRMSTPAMDGGTFPGEGDENYADADCPIAMFDIQTQQTQTQGTEKDVQPVDTYSKNTVKAISVIRKELRPTEGDDEEKVLSFTKMADKVSAFLNTISLLY